MSYDVAVDLPDGGHVEPYFGDTHPAFTTDGMAGNVRLTPDGYRRCGNYTSNVSPMWARCLTAVQGTGEDVCLADLEGKTCGDILPHLVAAVEWGAEHIDELRDLNPPNGWGNAEGAVTFLWDIQRICEANINGTLYISR